MVPAGSVRRRIWKAQNNKKGFTDNPKKISLIQTFLLLLVPHTLYMCFFSTVTVGRVRESGSEEKQKALPLPPVIHTALGF